MILALAIASWIAFLVSSALIIIGGKDETETHEKDSLNLVYAGFIGLALSGLMMTIAYGAYSPIT